MTRAELLALAARVEAAQGADREIDMAVAVAAGWTHADNNGGWWRDASGRTVLRSHVPRYTASLDAAASLVPQRWTRTMVSLPGYAAGVLVGDVICYLHHDVSSGGGPFVRGVASGAHAEARARTAAALRAMAEEAGE